MNRNFKFRFLAMISNLKLSIGLLLLIAMITMIGTVVEQDKVLDFYKLNYPVDHPIFGIISWKTIIFLGFDHIYTNIGFYLLLLFFSCSLIICTFSKQLPMLKVARTWRFFIHLEQFQKLPLNILGQIGNLSCCTYLLNRQGYFVFQQKKQIYAYKGIMGRVSPIIVHFSIICILFGSIISSFTGFVAQEIVPKGEVFHIQNILGSGNLSFIPQQLTGEIEDFWIAYNDDGSINQFFSNILLKDVEGEILKKQIISVNSPLRYNGVSIYQTDWNITGLEVLVDQTRLQLPSQSNANQKNVPLWSSHFSLGFDSSAQYIFVIKDLRGKIDVYDFKGTFLSSQQVGSSFLCDNRIVTIEKILTSTGLQIKADPGIPVIYFGFFLLMISTTLSYLTYSQIWLTFTSQFAIVGGASNRAVITFEEEFYKLFFSFK
nr:Ccs1 [Porphyropsis coccinea]